MTMRPGEASAPSAPTSHVIVPEPRPTDDVPYHHDRAPGQKYLVLDSSVVDESPIYVSLRRVEFVPRDPPRWLDPHEHECNSFYVFLGDDPTLEGLSAVVEIEGRAVPVEAPAAVMFPPRTLHHYWLVDGSGWYAQITLSPTYVGSLAPTPKPDRSARPIDAERLVRSARREGERWLLIDETIFDAPGVTVTAAELEGTPASGAGGRAPRLDVVLPRATGDGSQQIEGPVAVFSQGAPPRLLAPGRRGLVVTITPG